MSNDHVRAKEPEVSVSLPAVWTCTVEKYHHEILDHEEHSVQGYSQQKCQEASH